MTVRVVEQVDCTGDGTVERRAIDEELGESLRIVEVRIALN